MTGLIDNLGMTKKLIFVLFMGAFLVLWPLNSNSGEDWNAELAKGSVNSPYTAELNRLMTSNGKLLSWEKIPTAIPQKNKVMISCYLRADSKPALGIVQQMIISAPISAVKKVLDNIDEYQKYFPGYEKIEVLDRKNEVLLTYWEQAIPFPFPNLKYRMIYKIGTWESGRVYYSYGLTWSKTIKYSDGLIVLEPVKDHPEQTKYLEMDFWDTYPGLVDNLAPATILKESIEGVYISDRAIQIHAEQPELSFKNVQEKSKAELDKDAVKECISSRKAFQAFW